MRMSFFLGAVAALCALVSAGLAVSRPVGVGQDTGSFTDTVATRISESITVESYVSVGRTLIDPLTGSPVRCVAMAHLLGVDGTRAGFQFGQRTVSANDSAPIELSFSREAEAGDPDGPGWEVRILVRPRDVTWADAVSIADVEVTATGSR